MARQHGYKNILSDLAHSGSAGQPVVTHHEVFNYSDAFDSVSVGKVHGRTIEVTQVANSPHGHLKAYRIDKVWFLPYWKF